MDLCRVPLLLESHVSIEALDADESVGFLSRALNIRLVVLTVCMIFRVVSFAAGGDCPLLLSLDVDSGVFLVDLVDLDVNFSLGSVVDLSQVDCDIILRSEVLLGKGLCHVVALDCFVVHFHEFLLDAEIVVGDDQDGNSVPELLGKFLVFGGSFSV